MKRKTKTSSLFPKSALRTLLLLLAIMSATSTFAYDFEVDGIYYGIKYGSDVEVYVTFRDYEYNSYRGNVSIPGTVSYGGKTYTVTEIGEMAFQGCSELLGVNIPNTVIAIQYQAFSNCSGLKSIVIPNSVTLIEQAAFSGCTELTYLTLSNSISRICPQAFEGCTALTNIVIPNSVSEIGGLAFEGCKGLESLLIPNTVVLIEDGAFFGCSGLETILVEEGNPNYDSRDNCNAIIETDCNKLLTGCVNTTIPNSIDSIGVMAFYECTALSSISIPNSILSIGSAAFFGCEGLSSVHITDLGAWLNIQFADESSNPLFYAHHLFLNEQEIIDLTIPNTITSINPYVLSGCSALTSVTIPSNVSTIGAGSFSYCSGITGVDIPNSVCSIDENAFSNCTGLLSIDIPSSVSSIGDYAFSNCFNLSNISMTSSVTSMGYNVFGGTRWFNNQPDGIIYLGQIAYKYKGTMPNSYIMSLRDGTLGIAGGAFSSFSNLIGIDMPNTILTIGNGAFSGCYNLKSAHIPNSVISIGSSAFSTCWALADLTIGNNVKSIGQGAFMNCTKLKSIIIPNSVTSIYGGAFSMMSPDTLVIGNSVSYIDHEAFSSCIVKNLTWNTTNCSTNGAMTTEYIESVIIGEEVEEIPAGFVRNSKITSLYVPNSVKRIGNQAFSSCNDLNAINVGALNTIYDSRDSCNAIIEKVSNVLIAGCKNTIIPSSVTAIGSGAFLGLSSLTTITLPNTIDSIASSAFYGCTSLTDLIIPNSVKTIGDYAFRSCSNLSTLTLGKSLAHLGSYAFYYCSKLESVTSLAKTPPIMNNSYIFNCYNTATLSVPYSAFTAYQITDYWNRFANIVALDPIINISLPDTATLHGNTIVIPVSLENESELTAFQTDLYLPEGFELVKEDGDYLVGLSERKGRDHVIMANDLDDGGIRIISYSTTVKPYSGNEGELFYITVKTPDDGDGDYTIMLKNTLLTTTDHEELTAPDASCTVTVYPYIMGDVNNSGTVTVTDIVITARYILNYHPDPFVFGAADLNGDGNVTVTDIVILAQMILDGTTSYPPRYAPARGGNIDRMSGLVMNTDCQHRTVSIALDNGGDYTAFQLDLQLPEGITAENFVLTDQSGSHILDANSLDNGKTRLLCYAQSLKALNGDKETLLTFDVPAYACGDIVVNGIEMVTTECQTVNLDAFTIKMDNTSVDELAAGETVAKVEYFNLSGQQMERPTTGVTIVVTTFTNGTRSISKVIR